MNKLGYFDKQTNLLCYLKAMQLHHKSIASAVKSLASYTKSIALTGYTPARYKKKGSNLSPSLIIYAFGLNPKSSLLEAVVCSEGNCVSKLEAISILVVVILSPSVVEVKTITKVRNKSNLVAY